MEAFQREIFEKSTDVSLTKVVDTWLRTDSYPIVTVSVDVQQDEILIHQEQLLPQINSSSQRTFIVPVTMRSEGDDSDKMFFITTSTMVTRASDSIGNDTWLLLNTHGVGMCYVVNISLRVAVFYKKIKCSVFHEKGYYRTNYGPENWISIIDSLQDNYTAIDELTRTTLIDDAFNLARNGYLNYSIVFELVNASSGQEIEYLAWKSIFHNLDELLEYASDSCASQIQVSAVYQSDEIIYLCLCK